MIMQRTFLWLCISVVLLTPGCQCEGNDGQKSGWYPITPEHAQRVVGEYFPGRYRMSLAGDVSGLSEFCNKEPYSFLVTPQGRIEFPSRKSAIPKCDRVEIHSETHFWRVRCGSERYEFQGGQSEVGVLQPRTPLPQWSDIHEPFIKIPNIRKTLDEILARENTCANLGAAAAPSTAPTTPAP